MCGIEFTPPRARLLGNEVGEGGVSRPDLADVKIVALGPAEYVALDCLIEDPVPRIELHTWVDDRYHPEALLIESFEHSGRIGKPVGVPGEDAVAVHVFDVYPHGVARDVIVTMPLGDVLDSILGVFEPAALVVAKRPNWRRCRTAGEPCVGLQNRWHVRAREDVLGVLAATKDHPVFLVVGELVRAAISVV